MKIRNRRPVRRLSMRTLKASGRRNIIAACAIALTTLLFTSLFTIVLSINSSYETSTFRQIGGYSHGSFKDVDDEKIEKLSENPDVKEAGERVTLGTITDGGFAKVPAEVSYMDKNTAKWSYIQLEEGREPRAEDEMIMDEDALRSLGVEPQLGARITLTYDVSDKTQGLGQRTDTFTLVGWWKYDELSPVHFINVSKKYAVLVEDEAVAEGAQPFRRDLNVMLGSSINIDGVMERVIEDCGYQSEVQSRDDYVGKGVNWGYTASQAGADMDVGNIVAVAAFAVLIIFTGYLIIYNIFRISVTSDIRYYGLLKTIGVTPRQLRRVIRQQALVLCIAGCPVGLVAGWLVGYVLTPVVIAQSSLGDMSATVSASPLIFAGAAAFSVITVLLSCARPGRIASKVSPVEAARYTEKVRVSRKEKTTRGARVHQMAFANLGRSRGKSVLMVMSMSLAVVLLAVLLNFTGGFNMERYLDNNTCTDFIVGNTDYFRFEAESADSTLDDGTLAAIEASTEASISGRAWAVDGYRPKERLTRERFMETAQGWASMLSDEEVESFIEANEGDDGLVSCDTTIEGLDVQLMDKLTVLDGELDTLKDPNGRSVAISVDIDDYGDPDDLANYPEVGEKIPVTYVDEGWYVDSRTGGKVSGETPQEYIQLHIEKSHQVEYTVCALVTVPYQMSLRSGSMYGDTMVMNADRMREDCGGKAFPIFYMFDTPDAKAEAEAEEFLADLTADDNSQVMYESKATVREEFQGFRQMFLLLGSVLCGIIGLVGVLNFFNGIMTGILSRKREFAMLQSIGMTGKQLKSMLVYEGLLYALATVLISAVLIAIVGPLVGRLMESMFWFYEYDFSLSAVWMTAPLFLLLGALLPVAVYRSVSRKTIVERLRETE